LCPSNDGAAQALVEKLKANHRAAMVRREEGMESLQAGLPHHRTWKRLPLTALLTLTPGIGVPRYCLSSLYDDLRSLQSLTKR
jgi:hypothetical protein